ncbi:signal recognition particle 9 kDa protein-domain-containing protein [Mariannaea sp. PMI_226]|nr:signal recognition particle 9 kDa protein-domain-containing protein [Mariannaea sp. PMI_226]
MPYFKTSQEWLDQSVALLEARPASTNITTRYSLKPAPSTSSPSADEDSRGPPRGALILKTYDTVSGVSLKYRTTKAAEVSRLIGASLGRLGRSMAAVPEPPADEAMPDAPVDVDQKAGGAVAAAAAAAESQPQQQSAASGGGGKKKKKGKK